jgi:exopolysaccharide biosynthesis polyprenyl glycosylphosphotransferase
VLDALLLTASLAVSLTAIDRSKVDALPAPWLAAYAGVALAFFARRGSYRWRMRLDFVEQVRTVLIQSALALGLVLGVWALVEGRPLDTAALALVWLFTSSAVLVGRFGVQWRVLHQRQRARSLRPTLIVGAGHVATWLARRLIEHPEFGLRPVGFVDDDPRALNGKAPLVPVLGGLTDLESIAAEYDVRQVLVTFSRAPDETLLGVMDRCGELGVPVSVIPRLFERRTEGLTFENLGALPLIRVRPTRPRDGYFRVKYALDPVAAAAILLIALPVLVASALAVLISVGRPILFRQARVGRDGKHFEMLKFRTMRTLTEEEEEPLRNLPPGIAPGGVEGSSDRRTRVGRFLRATSLDEFPQFLNVLRGDMSLVGPRPERPEFVRAFSSTVRGYERRHRVKSGVTGWSQVHGLRGQTSIDDRAEYDNYYIENFSLWLDIKILMLTVVTVVRSLFRAAPPETGVVADSKPSE